MILPFVVVVAVLPLVGFAQVTGIGTVPDVGPTTVGGFVNLLGTILQIFYTIFFIIAAVFIILAAFSYLTAGGDDEKVKSAKQKLIYAIVAIVVALIATSVNVVISNFLGGQT